MQPEELQLTKAQWHACMPLNASGDKFAPEFSIEASSLGLKPGEWPTRITTPGGLVLKVSRSNADAVVYGDEDDIHLVVFND